MLYLQTQNRIPVQHIESGNLINNNHFLHSKRNLDFFILLLGVEGKLYIQQDQHKLCMEPNNFVILFPHHMHEGYQESDGNLSYYWTHFRIENYEEYDDDTAAAPIKDCFYKSKFKEHILLPEFGHYSYSSRVLLEIRQIIDYSMQNVYSPTMIDFSVNVLLMDLTNDYLHQSYQATTSKMTCNMIDIKEYIRVNYNTNLSVSNLANLFGYNANYLSTAYKHSFGQSITSYINQCRISVAKSLLLDTKDSVSEIAYKVGYEDCKYFFRIFRQFENMTPLMYRNAYFRKYVNIE